MKATILSYLSNTWHTNNHSFLLKCQTFPLKEQKKYGKEEKGKKESPDKKSIVNTFFFFLDRPQHNVGFEESFNVILVSSFLIDSTLYASLGLYQHSDNDWLA